MNTKKKIYIELFSINGNTLDIFFPDFIISVWYEILAYF